MAVGVGEGALVPAVLERQDTTVAAWIRHRRLERCRGELTDPAFADVPVSTVAARWGLVNSAHFSRLFRRAYGVSPVEYRRICLRPPRRRTER